MRSGTGGEVLRRSTGPSMVDVARRAGVAVGTVSNTLNRPAAVTEGTRLRVFAAIDELGFVRNEAARSLITGTSDIVGLVVVDLRDPYCVEVARGADAEVRDRGMRLLIADSDHQLEKQRQNIELFEQSRVAGIVLAPVGASAAGVPNPRDRPCPLEVIESHPPTTFSADGSSEGRAAVRRLLDRIRRA